VSEPLRSPDSDIELDLLVLMLESNAELLKSRLQRGTDENGGAGAQGPVIPALAAARALGVVLDDIVAVLVREARAQGQSWAAIGYGLQVSRQAVFQRFGPRTGEAAGTEEGALPDAAERAVQALRQFLAGEFEALRADFDQRMSEGCSVGLLKSVRSRLGKKLGRFLELGAPSVSSRPGYSVVDVPIIYRRGERKGRVAFAPDGRIAGFFVLTTNVV